MIAAPTVLPNEARESAFLFGHLHVLRLPGTLADDRAADYLAHWLARCPMDLTRHVQRINLHADRSEAERLFAALVDLFIVLGIRGEALRRRMLDGTRCRLRQEHVQCLEQALSGGVSVNHRLGDIPGSVLGRPVDGALDLVIRSARGDCAVRSVLEEARALLDEGHIGEARSQLETALADTPGDAAVADELLCIYQATRDRQGFLKFRQRLEEAGVLPSAWRDAALIVDGSAA